MATTPESKVKKKVKTLLDAKGAYYFSPIGGPYAKAGVPDIIACIAGRFVGIECKAGKGKLTALQEKNIAEILANGGIAFVINEANIDELAQWLDTL